MARYSIAANPGISRPAEYATIASENPQDLSQLFKRCLHLGPNLSVIERSIEALRRVSPVAVVDYLNDRENQLAPLLFWHLDQRGLTPSLGEQLESELRYRYQRNVARNALLAHSLEQIAAAFNSEGVDVLVLKGAAVFTPDLAAFRTAFVLSDVDLLVAPSHFRQANRTLIAAGYRPTHAQAMNGARKQAFVGADRISRVDLHSALFWASSGAQYRDYTPCDPWSGAVRVSVGGHVVHTLSGANQICHRLVHDAVGHTHSLLASSISRLYYLSVLVDFYRDRIDWRGMLEGAERKNTGPLLLACVYYGARELGLTPPVELTAFHRQGHADAALLDAVARSSHRLADYSHRTAVAVLMARSRRQRITNICRSFAREYSLARSVTERASIDGVPFVAHCLVVLMKMFCLQLLAVLYLSSYRFRHASRKESAHVA